MHKTAINQRKLFIGVVLVILAFFAVLAKGTSEVISYRLMQDSQEHYQLLANDTAETINSWLSAKKEIIENQRAALESIGDFSFDHLTYFLGRAIVGRKDLEDICDLYFLDKNNVLSSANGFYTAPEIDLRKRDWYTECLNTRDMFYSSPYLDLSTGNFITTVSVSCHDRSGQFMGVLALDLYIDAFLNPVNYTRVPAQSYVFLFDRSFGIATHPNPDFGYVDNLPQPARALPGNIYSELVSTISRGTYNVTLVHDYDGVDRYMFMSDISCCGWTAVAAISDSVMRSSERLMVYFTVGALFVSLSVGILWTLIGTRRVMEELSRTMDEVNAANETKSSFLANMSHEIRTPINAVIGMNEMIRREDISDTVREYSLDIEAASRSLVGIINDILDFSKIESGKLEMVEEEFDIGSTINDIVSLCVSRLGEKPLELIVRTDPGIPAGLIGDEMRIKQMIVNLMTNGIKYTNEGFVCLDISYTKRSYGINLDVSVRDSGIGITPENLEKLFTSFQQIDTKRNRSVEGTGLGLAITKRLAERMGGFVNVESEYGKGSLFRFSIPLRTADEKPFVSISSPENVHALCLVSTAGFGQRTADEVMRALVEMRKKLGLDIRICTDALKASRLLKESEISIVFADIASFTANERALTELSVKKPVFLVQSRISPLRPPGKVRTLYKPFYAIPFSSALHDRSAQPAGGASEEQSAGTALFTAPDAKILVVDDNIINLKVAAGLMKPYRMKLRTADSAAAAIAMLEEEKDYDIVFMDHMMPVMDGVEATKLIRSKPDEYYRKVPVIALTANTVNDARSMFLSSGFDDFLAKPIDTGALDRVLRKFIPEELRTDAVQPGAPAEKPLPAPGKDSLLDFAAGIRYSGGDEDLYNDILGEYVRSEADTSERISSLMEDKDWENYTIRVHSLKSTSMNIGAVRLSEKAKALEYAGKEGRYGEIERNTGSLLALYAEVIKEARGYLASLGIDPDAGAPEKNTGEAGYEEISAGKFTELVNEFITACENYDRDSALKAASRAKGLYFGEKALSDVFAAAAKLADDFEYDEAAQMIEKLREEADANG